MTSNLKSKFSELTSRTVEGNHRLPISVEAAEEHVCLNCKTSYHGEYCPACGQKAATERFTTRQTFKHLLFIFTKFDDRFWHTALELFYRPGHMIRDYICGRREDYLRPVQMMLCLITVYVLLRHFVFPSAPDEEYHLFSGDFENYVKSPLLLSIIKWVTVALNNKVVGMFAGCVASVLPYWICFRHCSAYRHPLADESTPYERLNIAEYFYAIVFSSCQNMILLIVALPFLWLFGSGPSGNVGWSLSFVLLVWIHKQLFQIPWRRSITLTLASQLLMVLIIIICMAIIAIPLFAMGIATPQIFE